MGRCSLYQEGKIVNIEDSKWNNPYVRIVDNSYSKYNQILKQSFKEKNSSLPQELLQISGMSGSSYRKFINNLVRNVNNPRYLEIGSWKGSTAAAAIYENKLTCVCIDNWSEFGGPKDEFKSTIEQYANPEVDFTIIEYDFREVDYSDIGKFNIFMFDGPHKEKDQYDGIVLPYESLDDVFILIVDDWNWSSPRKGTQKAIADLNLEVLCSIEVFTKHNSGDETDIPDKIFEDSLWHNGYFIGVCKK